MDDQNNLTVGTPDPNAGGMPPQDPGMGGGDQGTSGQGGTV